ncbi:hypothetical protein ScPMuIL_007318, partial [Solemya velum]
MQMLKEARLHRYMRKTPVHSQRQFFQLWGQYKDGEIGVTQMLVRISRVDGPMTWTMTPVVQAA